MKRWLKTRQCSTAVCTVRVYVNPVSVCGRILNTAGAFLEKLKFTARPRHVVIGREVGVSGCGLRSPFDTEIIAHTFRAAEHTPCLAELRRCRGARRRTFSCSVVVFHYPEPNIYCQVVGRCAYER